MTQTIEERTAGFAAPKDRIERVQIIESTLTSKGPEYCVRKDLQLSAAG